MILNTPMLDMKPLMRSEPGPMPMRGTPSAVCWSSSETAAGILVWSAGLAVSVSVSPLIRRS